jgi:predicted ABC-type ATPase
MIQRIRALALAGESFAFETTCAGGSHLRLLRECRGLGHRSTLLFLWLPSPEAALARVADRVAKGGHSVPAEVVVRRYYAGLRNMHEFYLPAVDSASIYDNSGDIPVLVAERNPNSHLFVHDPARWRLIEQATP